MGNKASSSSKSGAGAGAGNKVKYKKPAKKALKHRLETAQKLGTLQLSCCGYKALPAGVASLKSVRVGPTGGRGGRPANERGRLACGRVCAGTVARAALRGVRDLTLGVPTAMTSSCGCWTCPPTSWTSSQRRSWAWSS